MPIAWRERAFAMVTIATFDEAAKGRHLKDRFQQSGVRADVLTEGQMQAVASRSKRQANVKVLVDENDFEKAQNLLLEWEASDPEIGAAIRCPQCQSPRIDYPQLARKFPFVPGMAAILLAFKIVPKEFYCQDCQFTWGGDESIPRRRFWKRFFSAPQKQQS
jgi:predicted Zn-ribbon and HTH transcriptional regulator